ncbi:MAG TPA: TonB family protein [Anaeromyxobacter sp.]
MTAVRNTLVPAFAAAAALHGAALFWLSLRQSAPPPPRPRPPTQVRLVARTPPPALRDPEPPRPPAPPGRTAATRPRRAAAAAPPERAPAAPPEPGPAPPPRRFAVSMGATVPGGGVQVPVTPGATAARGDPRAPASAPVGDVVARGPADATDVDLAPRLVREPSSLELRAFYPEAARRAGLEADVRLEIVVDATGAVAEASVVGRAGNGFDEAAERAARRLRFSPAERGGRPVAVRIPWTLKFRIGG